MADKKTTVRDLKTFIDAVEFASDQDEWIPSAKQWKRIRDMINSLEEAPERPSVVPPQFFPVESRPQPQPQFGMPTGGAPVMPAVPAGPPSLSAPAMPQGPQPLPQVNNPLFNAGKTPDIDTGHGKPYQTTFV